MSEQKFSVDVLQRAILLVCMYRYSLVTLLIFINYKSPSCLKSMLWETWVCTTQSPVVLPETEPS